MLVEESPPNSLPPAEIALPGRSITQLTVLPVAFAAVPTIDDSDENTLAAKPRGSGSGSAPDEGFTVVGGCNLVSVGLSGRGAAGAGGVTVGAGVGGCNLVSADLSGRGAAGAGGMTVGAGVVATTGPSERPGASTGRATGNGAAANA